MTRRFHISAVVPTTHTVQVYVSLSTEAKHSFLITYLRNMKAFTICGINSRGTLKAEVAPNCREAIGTAIRLSGLKAPESVRDLMAEKLKDALVAA